MLAKRALDVVAALCGLALLSPLLLLMACRIRLDSPGPVFFRQERIGRHGVPFRIFKFRTMAPDTEGRGQITVGRDSRITRVGHLLRRYKLDELPQLLNVLSGEMSLVGPRPEVAKYVALYPAAQKALVLSVKPGITDLASITYRDENRLLGESADPERTYIEEIMPAKLRYYEAYVRERSLALDLKIILLTIVKLVR
ncbi:MAG TPA: sugar transferase [Janthinobacterium sp.]|nr:sugar transferase [Janthinobacterium sp.]